MLLYFILLGIVIQIFLFIRKSRHDFDVQRAAYENQKIMVGNQHHIADALIMLMKMIHHRGEAQTEISKLPSIEDLPN